MIVATMADDLSDALEHHRRGHLALAASAYDAVLADQPDRPDALHLRGLVALQQGDIRRAGTLIGRSVALEPTEASYHASLAEVHWALGDGDRAVASCRAALRLQPENIEALCNLASTLVARGDVNAAIGHYRDAIRLAPDLAIAHNNLANALRIKGDSAGALVHFREAVRLDPALAEAHSDLGRMLLDQEEPREALVHCQEAVRLRPDNPAACYNLANVLEVLGRLDEARAVLLEAIRLKPDMASAHASLGSVLEQLGDVGQAVASLREALTHDARHPAALARLATQMKGRLADSDLTAIESLLADPVLPSDRRWPLQFGLAHVLDARGDFQRAAKLSIEANSLQADDFRRRGLGYDPEAHSKFVDQLIAAFTPELFARLGGHGSNSDRPVFIVGLPRSGTSLTEQVLASHPRVFGAGETRLVRETWKALPAATGRVEAPLRCLKHLDQQAVDRLSARHLEALEALDGSAGRVVDKMPDNLLYLGLIALLFPRAMIIHCRRDVRDVALSCWMTGMAQVRWACDPDHIASRIRATRHMMDHWNKVLPVPVLEVEYQTMVTNLEAVSRELLAWCGLDWNPACLEFHKTRRPVRTASAGQVRQPVYDSSIGRWKNYEHALAPLFAKIHNER
jgi:tetratricopeptide (TPR) repeat protein